MNDFKSIIVGARMCGLLCLTVHKYEVKMIVEAFRLDLKKIRNELRSSN